jgi:hypothetical protein
MGPYRGSQIHFSYRTSYISGRILKKYSSEFVQLINISTDPRLISDMKKQMEKSLT